MSVRLKLALVFAVLFPVTGLAQDKSPVPDESAIKSASELIQNVFRDDFAKATTRQKKAALAATLLKQASETKDDIAGRYVLLVEASRLAGEAADYSTAVAAIEEIAKWHDVPVLQLKVDCLDLATKSATATNDKKQLAKAGFVLIDDAVDADEFDLARQIASMVSTSAREAKDFSLASSALKRKKELDDIEAAFGKVQAAKEKLATAPTDPAANLEVGRYLCFTKNRWDQGVALLALGADERLQAIAKSELQKPTSATDQMKVGDAWWDWADNEDGQAKASVLGRAAHWYSFAAPRLSGFAKAKVEKRLKEISPRDTSPVVETTPDSPTPRKLPAKFVNSVRMQMVLMPAGNFTMGSPATEPGRKPNESPQHTVKFTRPFYMAAHEVTVGQFLLFTKSANYQTEPERDGQGIEQTWKAPKFASNASLPVVQITWNDANEFCKWLSDKEKKTYRLPTEAEWEYACRAGTTGSFFCDERALSQHAWMQANSGREAHPVGTARPNPWGLFDMAGNVVEWCADRYSTYGPEVQTDPAPKTGEGHVVVRGGGWVYGPEDCRSAARDRRPRDLRQGSVVGFRVMCEVSDR